jgi:outer membrane receptor protein involved in Fe transport
VLGGVSITGNERLQRGLIANYDARWEWFPGAGEVLSAGVFAKVFKNPIERIEQATSGAYQATFQNARRATNYGVELEARRHLDPLGRLFHGITGFANVTVMRSSVTLDSAAALTVSDTRRRLVGQAPYVINSGITWTNRRGSASATILYNVVGDRIFAAGVKPLPNIVERAGRAVDVALRFPVGGQWSARLDARNLLDTRHQFMQGNLEREGYHSGRSLTLGMSWRS